MMKNRGVVKEDGEELVIFDTIKLGYNETFIVKQTGETPLNYKFIVNNRKQIVDYLSRLFMSETHLVGSRGSERIIVANEPDVTLKLLSM
ncbi:hypothetical protein P9X10_01530 [Bacillus cereus]|nr:hypothetical protein [Bacillus cereus]